MQIEILNHKKFGKMRVILLNGTLYFFAKDAATALGFKDTSKAIRHHVQEQDKFTLTELAAQNDFCPDNLAGQSAAQINFADEKIPHNAIWINESGLYALVLHSNLPFAKELQHWITSEVLPSIREKGYYINPYAETPPPAPVEIVPENELSRLDKIKILRECLEFTDCKQLRNKLIYDIAYLVTNKHY